MDITLGVYQIGLAERYTKEHMDKDGIYATNLMLQILCIQVSQKSFQISYQVSFQSLTQ